MLSTEASEMSEAGAWLVLPVLPPDRLVRVTEGSGVDDESADNEDPPPEPVVNDSSVVPTLALLLSSIPAVGAVAVPDARAYARPKV
jgi:hypothetical protein